MDVLDGFLAEVVGAAVADAGLHACAGHPAGEAIGIMISTLRSLLEEWHIPISHLYFASFPASFVAWDTREADWQE
jgi:hypothetical protein